jgi:voltage-gated potassium channel
VRGGLFANIIAVLGIGKFALPTGILGAGFVEEIQNSTSTKNCPNCGESLE